MRIVLILAGVFAMHTAVANELPSFHGWSKPGAGKAEFDAAASVCNERVLMTARGPLIDAERERAIATFRACMRERGWTLKP